MDLPKEKETELSLKLFIVLTRALEAVEKQVAKDIKRYGLNLSEFGVLELLYHKGDQPIQVIGQKILLASSSITYVIDKLEEKGLLERKACVSDRRVIYAHITENGEQLMREVFPKHEQAMNEIFACLTNEEKEILIEKIRKVGLHAENL